MAGVGASMGAMGSSPEMKGKGRGGGGQGVQVWGAVGSACGLLVAISSCFVRAEHEEKTIGRKEKKRRRKERRKRKGRKRKERKRKEKNWKI
jgi:heme exporter protein D